MPNGSAQLIVTREPGDSGAYRLAISGDTATSGPTGAFYRTAREIRNARVIEVDPPAGRAIPPGSNARTQLALWNELGADGKLWPQRAIRHAGSHQDFGDGIGPLGNWDDDNRDGTPDLGFVCIGDIDYRIVLRYADFNPVGLTSVAVGRPPASPEFEPWRVGEPQVPEGFSAAEVPAYDVDGDGVLDHSGFNGGGCHLYIAQFWTQPLQEYRECLLRAGGDGTAILQFMPQNAYVVRLPSEGALAAVAALTCVRVVTPYHPAYRLDHELMARYFGRDGAPATQPPPGDEAPVRYNIQVLERGISDKQAVAALVERLGGAVNELYPEGFRLSCTLTVSQLAALFRADQVAYADAWGEAGDDMDLVRQIGGADFLRDTPVPGFNGEGVRGEVMDAYIFAEHRDFQAAPVLPHGDVPPLEVPPIDTNYAHGTLSYGVIFADGSINPKGTGMLPSSSAQGIFASRLTPSNRYAHTAELVNPALNFKAVFQSNSWGTPNDGTTEYTTVTQEMDDILFMNDILVCQSQGNLGASATPQRSREQAWAKNIVSVGGIKHINTLNRDDDCWGGADCQGQGLIASTGPAADGRVKPDLASFGDFIQTSGVQYNCCSGLSPCIDIPPCFCTQTTLCSLPPFLSAIGNHGSTSAATPITAGHFGLFFQMWHEQVFPGFGGGASVFLDRPHMTTAKAMLINTAYRYDWGASATPQNQSLKRMRQGWGMADLHDAQGTGLYDLRNNMLIINETDDFTYVGESKTYTVQTDGTKPLRATLVYADPGGTTSAAMHRINDLSLKVSCQTCSTLYWGNNGLQDGNWSVPDGVPNKFDTVENVFIQSPTPGTWYVTVVLSELNADGNPETITCDADFALVVSGVTGNFSVRGGDWNGDGTVDAADLLAFLGDFVGGNADYDCNGWTESADAFAFFDALFAGEPPQRGRERMGGRK